MHKVVIDEIKLRMLRRVIDLCIAESRYLRDAGWQQYVDPSGIIRFRHEAGGPATSLEDAVREQKALDDVYIEYEKASHK
jgi:hypothetical protein